MTTPTDPLFAQQWHFPLIGDIETIWDEFTGEGVSVGVYDDGIETDHPDLVGNYDDSLEFEFDYDGDGFDETGANIPADPMTGNDGHGTSVAGLIAATADNGIGGAGVAYDASITSVNIFLDSTLFPNDYNAYVASLAYAGVFDIMSNSWGYTPLFDDFQNINVSGAQLIDEVAGLELAGATGRGGLGTVIVQAAGNDTLNANGDSINASRFTITVGATDEAGFVQDYSNYGVSLLISAPAASVTTDLTGTDGYNDGSESVPADYTETFGGTSAATPVVSGVIALMLEANENLGWRDVHNILAVTASQTGQDLDGTNATIDEVGSWGAESGRGGSTWNGGTLSYHLSYGFGMVDAFAAVRMAETWLDMLGDAQTSANEQHVSVDYDEVTNGAIAIPDFDVNTSTPGVAMATVNVAQNIQIETILVTVDITHTWGSDLEIYLVNPDGDQVPLFFRDGNSNTMDNGFVWTFEVRALLGFDSQGDWSIAVLDQAGGDVGTINDFQLDFYGATADNDNVHIISRDFQELTAHDAARMVITDTNGGRDWLNFTGIQGDVDLDMSGGGLFSVDTVGWGSLQAGADVFEGVILGDGNDDVTGNSLANDILGMRGDDTIDGAGGADFIDGGDGNDTIQGGIGSDTILGGFGNDELRGGDGFDEITGADGADMIYGDRGNDILRGGDGSDTLFGGDNVDELFGGNGADILRGEGFGDTLRGEAGNDQLFGGDANDTLFGGANNDQLFGGNGRDVLRGEGFDDELYGENGDDMLFGGDASDLLRGGNQNDMLFGGNGVDELRGDAGNDKLFGENGNDQLFGGDASDELNGGNDNDDLFGGNGVDILRGDAGNDELFGERGNDQLFGGVGNDRLNGGNDNDTLNGGAGVDTFIFTAGMARDTVQDFVIDTDLLQFSAALWAGDPTPPTNGTEIINEYASTSGNTIIFDFGNGNVATLTNALTTGTLLDLANDIAII